MADRHERTAWLRVCVALQALKAAFYPWFHLHSSIALKIYIYIYIYIYYSDL